MRKLQKIRPPRVQLTYDIEPPFDEEQHKAQIKELIDSVVTRTLSIYGNHLNVKLRDTAKKFTCLGLFISSTKFFKTLHGLPDNKLNKDRKKLIAFENFLLLMALKVIQQATITPICNTIRFIESIFLPIIFIVIRNFTIQKNLSISA